MMSPSRGARNPYQCPADWPERVNEQGLSIFDQYGPEPGNARAAGRLLTLSQSVLCVGFRLLLNSRRVLAFKYLAFKMGDFGMRYGYARVSSRGQDYQGQVEALKAAGCEKIYSEKISGKSTDDRRQFKRLMNDLLPGDVVLV